MKNIISLIFLLVIICLTSCNNVDDNAQNSIDQLPPATQTGANAVGCLVNGEVFLPRQEGINPAVVVNYEFFEGDFFFSLSFDDQKGVGLKGVTIGTLRVSLQTGQTYILNKNNIDDGDFTGGGGLYTINTQINYYTNSTTTGELTITRIDLSNSIISGTFWFDAINAEGDIVEIREGRFDYQY
jgi:hypothetical protein